MRRFRCEECFGSLGDYAMVRQPDGRLLLFEARVPIRSAPGEKVFGMRGARKNPRFSEWRSPEGDASYAWTCPGCGRPIRRRGATLQMPRPGTEVLV